MARVKFFSVALSPFHDKPATAFGDLFNLLILQKIYHRFGSAGNAQYDMKFPCTINL